MEDRTAAQRASSGRRRVLVLGILQALAVLCSLMGITVLVYLSGTESISIHLFYLPIIYAGYAFGDYGAIITSLLAAAFTAHGAPARIMPDGTTVAQGEWEPAIRAAVFFVIGMASSRASLELRRRATEFRTLYEVAQTISSTLRLRQVLELIVSSALSVIDAKGCAIRLYNEESGELELVAMKGLSETYWQKGAVRLEESPIDQRAMAGEPVQVRDVGRDGVFQYPEEARQEGIRAVLTVPLKAKDSILGVVRVYSTQRRRFTRREVQLLIAFANQAAVAIENAELYEDIRRNYYETVRALTAAIEAQDRSTYSHSERVTELTEALAAEIGLSPEEIELVRFGAILHDIGKITLQASSAPLGPAYEDPGKDMLYRMHPIVGASILQPISFLQPVLCIVKYHHERWDGKGFPEGLKGKDIPFYARIVAITDAYERLLNPRESGEQRLEPREAIEEILSQAGSAFDPEIVAAFHRLMQKRPELAIAPEMSRPLVPPPNGGALGETREDKE